MAHLGRPQRTSNIKYSLAPVAQAFGKAAEYAGRFAVVTASVKKLKKQCRKLKPVRFDAGKPALP